MTKDDRFKCELFPCIVGHKNVTSDWIHVCKLLGFYWHNILNTDTRPKVTVYCCIVDLWHWIKVSRHVCQLLHCGRRSYSSPRCHTLKFMSVSSAALSLKTDTLQVSRLLISSKFRHVFIFFPQIRFSSIRLVVFPWHFFTWIHLFHMFIICLSFLKSKSIEKFSRCL